MPSLSKLKSDSSMLGRMSNVLENNSNDIKMNICNNTKKFCMRSSYDPLNKLLMSLSCQETSGTALMTVYREFQLKIKSLQYDSNDILDADVTLSIRLVNNVRLIQNGLGIGVMKTSISIADDNVLNIIQRMYELLGYDVVKKDTFTNKTLWISFKQK